MAVADSLTSTTLTGFRSLRPLSSISGSWDSFNGYSEELKREVSLAVVRAEALREESVRRRFQEAAKVVSALQHPSLQRCLMAVPLPDGRWSVLSEPVDGSTLQEVLSQSGRLACDDAVQLVTLLCDAVDSAHQQGVVHGDIAPHNVLLPGGLQAFKPKLTGMALGLLRRPGASAFSAPELKEGKEASPLSDIFSLGAVLYACLTGAAPQGRDDDFARLPPGTEHLISVLRKCMAKDLGHRYFAAGEVSKALHQANGTLVPPSASTQRGPTLGSALTGETMLGPYQLVKLLGEGSMGQVFLARHKALGRQVAIKVLRPEQYRRGDLIQRFFQEARTVNQINHEHIVEIFDFVQEPGPDGPAAVYCVMELLQGLSLTASLESGPFTLKRSLNVVRQLCDALFAAHKVGVVHRDVKPDNIFLIDRAGQSDYVKVLDFGVAKLTHAAPDAPLISTMDGAIIGTPMCMAPEQAAGAAVDYRADIYAVGVIMYLLLSGRLPFDARNFATLAVQLITQPPPPLPDHNPAGEPLAAGLKAVVLKCLAKQPEQRPQSMREVAEAIVPYMSMSAIRASEPSLRPVVPQMRPAPTSRAVKGLALGGLALAALATVGAMVWRPLWSETVPPSPAPSPSPSPPPTGPDEPPPVGNPDKSPEPAPVKPPEPTPPTPPEPNPATPPEPTPLKPPEPTPAKPPKPVEAKLEKLTPEIVVNTVKKSGGEVRACINRHRTDLKEPSGAVRVEIIVQPSGEVQSTTVQNDGLKGTGLETCIVREGKRIKFPRTLAKAAAKFVVPFTYNLK